MTFLRACKDGDLLAARGYSHEVSERGEAFRCACGNGHLEVAQWIYTLGGVDHHAIDEYAFREASQKGHL